MTSETLLLRQIHPSFVQKGRVTSQAFRPTPKDEHLLSVDNGDKIAAHAPRHDLVREPAPRRAAVIRHQGFDLGLDGPQHLLDRVEVVAALGGDGLAVVDQHRGPGMPGRALSVVHDPVIAFMFRL